MPTCDWHEPDPGHGPAWHAVMSVLTIFGLFAVAALLLVALGDAL